MDILSLKKLAMLGAHRKPVELSSIEFALHIDSSPQTAARKLKYLEDERLIARQILHSGQLITITENGLGVLQKELNDYQEIFSGNGSKKFLSGKVITGLGEGQYYISLEGYRTQFIEKLGFDPYPGTLNIRLDTSSIGIRKGISANIKISGFTDQSRTFGRGSCFRVMVKDIRGAVVVPERTHYPEDIIEIIAPVNLREYLNISDGSIVKVEVIK
ncbi:transcriptional regulator of a riboflavin/FAD biosynthetic operon [Candidatus Methanoperedens nitroreducens]|uniref:Riboflavin kinase n=1 Tax=Candidatus Methanoperedens nitratireducens TaxID=1392998 RepID=A0A062V7Z8_9EURY|nr:winged helix-turn-helix domain-containing protein/riboflavin kinase [Candidatus Methanoperedens nitroreducens]KCZ71480.1 transcriptional regulator of a riboflavin/FAD biosynthetic operon [Candidatus Methanoperedens nitroreducens]MDJ1421109.1 winged helix-turn-helix domain-containing protein/riboflavin kinase [Candidatus Methanoperedens sp.]